MRQNNFLLDMHFNSTKYFDSLWVGCYSVAFYKLAQTICDTQKDGAVCCILGRLTCWPQIYYVCMGICRQVIFIKSKLLEISKQQKQGIRLKTVLTKSEGCGCGRRHVTALLISHTLLVSWQEKMYEKLRMPLDTFQHTKSFIFGQCNLLPSLTSLFIHFFRSLVFKKIICYKIPTHVNLPRMPCLAPSFLISQIMAVTNLHSWMKKGKAL